MILDDVSPACGNSMSIRLYVTQLKLWELQETISAATTEGKDSLFINGLFKAYNDIPEAGNYCAMVKID